MIGSVAVGLGFVIFVHELGHFLVAKWCGVKCEKFYVGFDVPIKLFGFQLPSKLVHYQWGETEYGVGIIPLGGYVKMLGQDDDPRAAKEEMERIKIRKNREGGGEAKAADATKSSADTDRGQALAEGTAAEGMVTGQTIEQADHDDYELDPRSFPAKSVPQRMAIISAGVIMNLIFAVLFAAFAFRSGVKYTPCEVESTAPGSPAWLADLEPGSKILQIGENGRHSEKLRFVWDLSNGGVGLAGANEDLPLLVRTPDGTEKWIPMRPVLAYDQISRPMLGISPRTTTKIRGILPESAADNAEPKRMADGEEKPALQPGDRITAIDGMSVTTGAEVTRYLIEHRETPIRLTIDPNDKDDSPATLEVTVPPQPLKRLGLVMKMGPIIGVQPNSPAAQAGLQAGDKVRSIAGQPVDDPMLLPALVYPHYGETIDVAVQRGEASDLLTLQITPRLPTSFDWQLNSGIPMASDALGFSYGVGLTVNRVEPDSSAASTELRPGDKLVAVKLESKDKEKPNSDEIALMEGEHDWLFVFGLAQAIPAGTVIKLTFERDSEQHTVELQPAASDAFNPFRGFALASVQEKYVADSWWEALQLGWMQTGRDATRVVRFLRKLVTGQIPISNVGGPLTIAYVAGSQASEGLPSLLIFFTFLSANLAVINFLPIPALDGGHFVFLCWEGLSGKPVNERVQIALTLAGVAGLLCLMIFVFYLDIDRLFL